MYESYMLNEILFDVIGKQIYNGFLSVYEWFL